MKYHRHQTIVAGVAGVLQTLLAVSLYLAAARCGQAVAVGFIWQTASILMISALTAFLSSVHSWFAGMAQEERQRDQRSTERDGKMFRDELDADRRQQRALAQFRVVIVPILLILISILEAGLSFWILRLASVSANLPPPADVSPVLLCASILAISAVTLFIFGKYCAGIAFHNQQHFLRPIAGRMSFAAVVCCLALITAILYYWKLTNVPTIFTYAACLAAMFLAVERVVLWLMDMYRPQADKADKFPVYESRALALFVQPRGFMANLVDIVDYQFGVTISEAWIVATLKTVLLPLFVAQLATLALLTTIVYVQPHETGVVERWGTTSQETLSPGLYCRWPWPVARVQRVPTARIQQITWNGPPSEANHAATAQQKPARLWHDEQFAANLFLTGGSGTTSRTEAEPSSPAGSVNIAAVTMTVQYTIADPVLFVSSHRDAKKLLTDLSRRELVRYLSGHEFRQLMTLGSADMRAALRQALQGTADANQLGVHIVDVAIPDLQPPPQLAPVFQSLIDAQEQKRQRLVEAEQFAYEATTLADRDANRIVREAESETARITSMAAVEQSNFARQREIYHRYPELYRGRRAMDMMEAWLKDVEKIVLTTEGAHEVFNLELKKAPPDLLSAPLE